MKPAFLSLFLLTALIPPLAAAEEEVDYSNALTLISEWMEAQRAYDRVPGLSAAAVHDQELLWSAGYGQADIESGEPARPDTIYGICSISKLFTGIAVMQLRDQGLFRLSDPVDELLPWFDLEQVHEGSPDITLSGMLTHSSGLPRESDTPYWTGPDFRFPTREEIRELLGSQSTLYPADLNFQYSNLALTLAGEVVAEKSGQDYEAYVRQHILAPMGLADTDTGFPEDDREPRVATGYAYPDRAGNMAELPRYDTRGITPAAGFASTALDLARFASWQFRVRSGDTSEILATNTLREMQRVHWMDWDFETSWGIAFGIYRDDDRTLTGHGGSCPGFNTRIFIDPMTEFGVAVLANRNWVDVSGYAKVVLGILEAAGAPSDDAPDSQDATVNLDDFAGNYSSQPWGGESLVFRWNDGLRVTGLPSMDPLGEATELQHVDGDLFRIVRDDGESGHEVRFLRGADGAVERILWHSNYSKKIDP